LIQMIRRGGYVGFFAAQFFASMTRGVLWGGTLLLYATFAYNATPQLLGGLATTASIVGIPITLSCGYLMDRFGRKTTMVPGFSLIALGLMFLASGAQWHWSLVSFIAGFLWIHASHSVTSGSMQVIGSDMAPANARGRFFGFWRLIGEIGSLVSPLLFAFVAEHLDYSAAFALFSLGSLATAILLAFSVKETRRSGRALN
jgi:ACDE family multidrug resistance protein